MIVKAPSKKSSRNGVSLSQAMDVAYKRLGKKCLVASCNKLPTTGYVLCASCRESWIAETALQANVMSTQGVAGRGY